MHEPNKETDGKREGREGCKIKAAGRDEKGRAVKTRS